MSSNEKKLNTGRRLRILLCNRPNTYTNPGGDTVLMERLKNGLINLGHDVEIDVDASKEPAAYDIAHLFNFASPEATEFHARRCFAASVPYVVSCLYEDWPRFFNKMTYMYYAFETYIKSGQDKSIWAQVIKGVHQVEPRPYVNNSWVAENAASLLVTGEEEKQTVQRDYNNSSLVEIVHLGCDTPSLNSSRELFIKETSLSDFVLCVGRLEARKNQLMLLKALEDSELTVVFATSGFTYQPQYEALCRNFKRKGKTVFLPKLSSEMLKSAYMAAKVHALPSWYELPGLVSLEAAECGCSIVGTKWGTLYDYLGEDAYYCSPDDIDSIKNAVCAAYYSPKRKTNLENWTWDFSVAAVNNIYSKVLSLGLSREDSAETKNYNSMAGLERSIENISLRTNLTKQSVEKISEVVAKASSLGADRERAKLYCSEGDSFVRAANYQEARKFYEHAISADDGFARAYRSLGVIAIQEKDFADAKHQFRKALTYDPSDVKSLIGLGSVYWEEEEKEQAFSLYMKAAQNDPTNTVAVLYLINASYALNRLKELEQVLRQSLLHYPEDANLQYCLAGCYFRQGKTELALGVVERTLRIYPSHPESLELKEILENKAKTDRGSLEAQERKEEDLASVVASSHSTTESYSIRLTQAKSPRDQLFILEEAKRNNEFELVETWSKRIIEISDLHSSEYALAQIILAESLGCLGKVLEADSEFVKAESNKIYGYRALVGRGALSASLGKWAEASSFFSRSLMFNEKNDVAYAGLGMCAMNIGQLEEAWKYYETALSYNVECIQAIYGIVQLSYRLNRLWESEVILKNYLDFKPANLSIVYALAGCLYAQGKREEAKERCKTILLFEPEDATALELLNKIEEKQCAVNINP